MAEIDLTRVHPIFAAQIKCMAERDLDGLMDTYHPEAVVIRFQGILSGAEEIRNTFGKYIDIGARYVALREYAQSEDTIFVRALMQVRDETEIGVGMYVLKDGRIWRQAAGIEGDMRDWFAGTPTTEETSVSSR